MSHWWHCCDDDCPYGGPPDCQAKPDGIVWWFTHTVNDDNTITRVDHSEKCYTVYVDSVSGDVVETGNGTESRPFVNLNSIFIGWGPSGASGTVCGAVLTRFAGSTMVPGRWIGLPLTLDGIEYTIIDNTATTITVDSPFVLSWALTLTVSGSGAKLASGVLTPSPAPSDWIGGNLVGHTVTIGGTEYTASANTTTNLTTTANPDVTWSIPNCATSGTGATLVSGVLTVFRTQSNWKTDNLAGHKVTLGGTDYTITANTTTTLTISSPPADDTYAWQLDLTTTSGTGKFLNKVLTPNPAPTDWLGGEFVDCIYITIDGTRAYTVASNSTTAFTTTADDPHGSYAWELDITASGTGAVCDDRLTPNDSPLNWLGGDLDGNRVTIGGVERTVASNTTTTLDTTVDIACGATVKSFDWDCIGNICSHAGPPDNCPKVKVLVKGTVDYNITGCALGGSIFGRRYGQNLVFEPWGSGRITIAGTVDDCIGMIWKRTDAHFSANAQLLFDECTDTGDTQGFPSCTYSAFDGCTGTGSTLDPGTNTYGFAACWQSTFRNCAGTANGTLGAPGASAFGFGSCYDSAFDGCTGTGNNAWLARGFDYCSGSTFIDCIGAGISFLSAYGFSGCGSSSFVRCEGTGTATLTTTPGHVPQGVGFYTCSHSTFDDCEGSGAGSNDNGAAVGHGFQANTFSWFSDTEGTGDATGTSGCRFACGFYQNTCSVFIDCTPSDKICIDCGSPCPYECDDLDNDVEWTEHEIEGVLKLEAEHSILDIRETIEGVLKLEAEHSIQDIRETIEGVLALEISHTLV